MAPSARCATVDSVMQAIFQYPERPAQTPIAQTYALEEYKAAIAYAQAPRMGKVSLALSKTVLACAE